METSREMESGDAFAHLAMSLPSTVVVEEFGAGPALEFLAVGVKTSDVRKVTCLKI